MQTIAHPKHPITETGELRRRRGLPGPQLELLRPPDPMEDEDEVEGSWAIAIFCGLMLAALGYFVFAPMLVHFIIGYGWL